MNKRLTRSLAIALTLTAVVACNRGFDTARLQKAFEGTPAEAKVDVDKGIAAISQTNYPVALESFERMTYRRGITVEQRKALQDVIAKLKERVPRTNQ